MNRSHATLLILAVAAAAARGADDVDFTRDIAPILAAHCYDCHGPDARESGLRLDRVATMMEGGDLGPAVVPGESAKSPLYLALVGKDGLERMPLDSDPLADAEIERIRAWIDAGARAPADESPDDAAAVDTDHWSFQPVAAVEIPTVSRPEWVDNPIDAFVLARLDAEGIEPSPEADRATLIRRVSFDLVGIPPRPEEVAAFIADHSPDAYARLVDRLLASPAYGERWGRHWLDQARYADSNGYTIDGPRSMWKYRRWVIEALNRDLPFDQFTIEQIAGDVLPDATLEQVVATGFHRNTMINEEGGTDDEQFRVDAVADRVATTGSVFLGLTIGCARCHDHKFDPITQRDYYRLFACLNNADEPTVPVPTADEQARLDELDRQLAAARNQLAAYDRDAAAAEAAWLVQFNDVLLDVAWHPVEVVECRSEAGSQLEVQPDGSILVGGELPDHDIYTVECAPPDGIASARRVTAVRLEVLTHDSLPGGGPGRASNGNFVLGEVEFTARAAGTEAGAAKRVAFSGASADHSQKDFDISHAIDGDPSTGWAINVTSGDLHRDRTAIFVVADDVLSDEDTRWTVRLVHAHRDPQYLVGRFRLSITLAARPLLGLGEAELAALRVPAADRTDEQRQLLTAAFRNRDENRKPLVAAVEAAEGEHKKFRDGLPTAMVLRERAEPRATHIMIRGDFLRHGAQVSPGVPEMLPPLADDVEQATRLDLAHWLVSRENPLTARVTVNRIWLHYFGRGIVETDDDFGSQGAEPTHPELLDWLAGTLVDGGWSLKAIHRLIVTSSTYRQASHARPELAQTDPQNRLLARQSRLRLEAEAIRDTALAVSGLLSRKIGGPSVFPPQPEGVMRLAQVKRPWQVSAGSDRYRRGLYTYFWRSTPYAFSRTFDAPDANNACTRRTRSNTPLQALMLLNDDVFIECAAALARRIVDEASGDDDRIEYIYQLCLARKPGPYETDRLRQLLADVRTELGDSLAAAGQATATAEAAGTPGEDVERAAWNTVARVMLNLDEFITRE